jgi:hypothetical protein
MMGLTPPLSLISVLVAVFSLHNNNDAADALTTTTLSSGIIRPTSIPQVRRRHNNNNNRISSCTTSLHGWNNGGTNTNDDMFSNFFGRSSPAASNDKEPTPSLITSQMEEEVMASARATMDANAVSRAVSSLLIDDDRIKTTTGTTINKSSVALGGGGLNSRSNKNSKTIQGGGGSGGGVNSNKLRDLATGNTEINRSRIATTTTTGTITQNNNIDTSNNNNNFDSDTTAWNTQQIAIASGVTVMLLSPVVIPILHVLLPPIIPSPSSISFTGAALLGALAYIVALGDPTSTDQSNNIISSTIITSATGANPLLGEGVEVGGAVSRIVGRTALQSVKASAPRVKAVARAAFLDYDTTTPTTANTLEELQNRVDYLSRKTLQLDDENQLLRYELALYNAVENIGSLYKLEELKELARYRGVKGYSTESKNALLRRLVKEQVLELDLTPYL